MSLESSAGPGRLSRRDALKITAIAGVTAALGDGVLSEVLRQRDLHRVVSTRPGLGTLVTLTIVDTDRDRARATTERAFARLEHLEGLLSRHRPTSIVATLNRMGRVDAPPRDVYRVVELAQALAAQTGGAFDATVAPLQALYAERFASGRPPTDVEISEARACVGHEALQVSADQIAFSRPGMAITLDGIAKGYVVDQVVVELTEAGCKRVLVDAGGDIGSGPHDSMPGKRSEWTIAVADPTGAGGPAAFVPLGPGRCIATSGDYMQPYLADRSAHPIIDPRTGYSPEAASSATALAPSAALADGLSTAALVLGPQEGTRLLESWDSTEGLVIGKDGTGLATSGWLGVTG